LVLDHLCSNRRCVKPSHLEAVSFRENILRGCGPSAENARRSWCVNGHPYIPENTARTKGGDRYCRICSTAKQRIWRALRRAK
jgi:hypothetical protein